MCYKGPAVSSPQLSIHLQTLYMCSSFLTHVTEQNFVWSDLFNIIGKTFLEQLLCSRHRVRCGRPKCFLRGLGVSPWIVDMSHRHIAGNVTKSCIYLPLPDLHRPLGSLQV